VVQSGVGIGPATPGGDAAGVLGDGAGLHLGRRVEAGGEVLQVEGEPFHFGFSLVLACRRNVHTEVTRDGKLSAPSWWPVEVKQPSGTSGEGRTSCGRDRAEASRRRQEEEKAIP